MTRTKRPFIKHSDAETKQPSQRPRRQKTSNRLPTKGSKETQHNTGTRKRKSEVPLEETRKSRRSKVLKNPEEIESPEESEKDENEEEETKVDSSTDDDFDRYLSIKPGREEFYNNVVMHESILYEHKIDFKDLKSIGLDIGVYFDDGCKKYMSLGNAVYPRLVRMFYANLWVIEKMQNNRGMIELQSIVNGTEVVITERILHQVLGMPCSGFDSVGKRFFIPSEMDFDGFKDSVLAEEGVTGVLVATKMRAIPRLLYLILCTIVLPRKGSKANITNDEILILYHILHLEPINFASIVLHSIAKNHECMIGAEYKGRMNFIHLPYARLISIMIAFYGVDIEAAEHKVPIKQNEIINGTYLGPCKIVKSKRKGWILFKFVEDDDELEWGCQDEGRKVKKFSKQTQNNESTVQPTHTMAVVVKKMNDMYALVERLVGKQEEINASLHFLKEKVEANTKALEEIKHKLAEMKSNDNEREIPDTPPKGKVNGDCTNEVDDSETQDYGDPNFSVDSQKGKIYDSLNSQKLQEIELELAASAKLLKDKFGYSPLKDNY